MKDFMPSAAEVKKESDELFAEVGNQGDHAGNTAADDDDEGDEAPARPAGRGGKRGGAGRKADAPDVKAAKAAVRAETKAEAKVIEAAKLAAIRTNLSAAVDTPSSSEGGEAAVGGGGSAAARKSAGVGPRPQRARAGSRRESVASAEDLEAMAALEKSQDAEDHARAVTSVFNVLGVPETTTRQHMDVELSKRENTIAILKPIAARLGLKLKSDATKAVVIESILNSMYGRTSSA